jgi:hypothetical protein
MALSDTAVMLPGRGYFFTNPTPGAAPPADTQAELDALDLTAATLATSWVNGGHTSRENAVALDKEGDDPETKGTWQAPSLRTTSPVTTWKIGVPQLQFDNAALSRYFGEGDISDPDVFHVLSGAASVEEAMFLVLVDGSSRVGLYQPKVSWSHNDAPEFDPEEFVEFPTIGTVLDHTGASGLMSWYKAGLGTPAP